MGMTKAQKAEHEKREAEWHANEARVRHHGDLFAALPDGAAKDALLAAMTDRVIDLYNNVRMPEGDAIVEFMPNDYAHQFMDWYFFDEDRNSVFPPQASSGQDDTAEQTQVQRGSQGDLRADRSGAVEAHAECEAPQLSVAPAEPAGADRHEPGRSQ
jgi:hypothetical protein